MKKRSIPAAAIKAYGTRNDGNPYFEGFIPVKVKGIRAIGWTDNQLTNACEAKQSLFVWFFGIKYKNDKFLGGIEYQTGYFYPEQITYL